ncbi:hypothetical protein LTR86_004603 [Recurvomyces mirabilis]|nr:hypothetical protein LTR86_004603 [Recurvomyces mirabilis]
MKVIDTDAPAGKDIVALGRWHEYPYGYVAHGDAETTTKLSDGDTTHEVKEFNTALYTNLLGELVDKRREPGRFGTGSQWVLTTLATREPYRRKGAGGLILEWGLEQARKAGVPAFLEAAVGAKHLYESHGFKEIEKASIDCSDSGMPGVVVELAIMRADPGTCQWRQNSR